jgi:hypothetical protein
MQLRGCQQGDVTVRARSSAPTALHEVNNAETCYQGDYRPRAVPREERDNHPVRKTASVLCINVLKRPGVLYCLVQSSMVQYSTVLSRTGQ